MTSPHFIVVSNAREDVALEVAKQFEQIRIAFRKALPRARTGESRLLILAVKNEKSLKELLPEFWERKNGFRPGGIFRERGYHRRIALRVDGQGPEAYSLIYHEYFHLPVNLNAPGLPSWFNEGLASYWENTTFRADKVIAGQPSGRYIRLLSREEPLALEVVFTSYPASHDNRASMFYAQSWALTHYLLIGDREARAHLLKKYISLVTEGSGSLEAARLAFGDLEELENKLRQYTRRLLFNAVRIRASAEADALMFRSREISEAESLALRGHFLALGGAPDRGERLLKKALRKRPGPPVAAEGMGWIALRRGDREAAETWFEKAASSPRATHVAHYMSAVAKENTPEKEAQFLEALSLDRAFAPAPVMETIFQEAQPSLSPDGRFVAYHSNVSGDTRQIFIQPFPGPGGRRQISTNGGRSPRWSPTGGEIFFQDPAGRAMMAVEVQTDPEIEVGIPEVLFEWGFTGRALPNWDITPDGERFVMVSGEPPGHQINFVLNWFEEIERLVPTR